jgi:pSer/pThr/pTyr-binding forkhead associated (FHA) protein
MARFIVLIGKGMAHRFASDKARIDVGRSEGMDLILPNVSVSRHHARIICEDDQYRIEDVGSRNGVRLNQDRLEPESSRPLNPGDEMHIGKYTLVLLEPGARFFRGRFLEYMTVHAPENADSSEMSTFQMSADDVAAYERERRLIRNAKVMVVSNESLFWHPEDNRLTFGKQAMVHVSGLLVGDEAAEIVFEQRRHIIKKIGGMGRLRVNGGSVQTHRLRDGDRFKVGDTEFIYREG